MWEGDFRHSQRRDPYTDIHETWNDPASKITGGYVDVGGLGK